MPDPGTIALSILALFAMACWVGLEVMRRERSLLSVKIAEQRAEAEAADRGRQGGLTISGYSPKTGAATAALGTRTFRKKKVRLGSAIKSRASRT